MGMRTMKPGNPVTGLASVPKWDSGTSPGNSRTGLDLMGGKWRNLPRYGSGIHNKLVGSD